MANDFPPKEEDSSPPHITVLYIGKQKAADVERIKNIISEAISGAKSIPIRTNGLGWFTSDQDDITQNF